MLKQIPIEIAEPLIHAVQKREVLYNIRSEGYKNRNVTELAWKNVADELQRDVIFCRTTWATLRGTFNRILAQMKSMPSGPGASKLPRWYLFEKMYFLGEHVAQGQLMGNLEISQEPTIVEGPSQNNQLTEPAVESPQIQNTVDEHDGFTLWNLDETPAQPDATEVDAQSDTSTTQQTQPSTASTSSKKKRKCGGDPVKTAFLELVQQKKANQAVPVPQAGEPEDADLLYFKGLLPFIKQLAPKNKRRFMAHTTAYLMELIDEQEQVD